MVTRKRSHRLFEAYGIELEYMVVDRDTLQVRPLVDELFTAVAATPVADLHRGRIDWSNELTNHVVEVRIAKPAKRLSLLGRMLHAEVQAINAQLATRNAMLLPTGAHPTMDPARETVLWPHEHHATYTLFDKLFGCHTHGWANAQSTHLNLSFQGDEEFAKLHAAVRLLLPIIPAIAASSPILGGKWTGFMDARMEAYLHAQEAHPEMMGSLIPEAVFNQEDYYREVFGPIGRKLAPLDPEGLIDHHFANTRGAVARFDRGSIEVRVMDTQECPSADLAVCEFIAVVLKALVEGRWVSSYLQRAWPESDLLAIFLQTIKDGGHAVIANREYLLMFGLMRQEELAAGKLWQHLFVELYDQLSPSARQRLTFILDKGSLAARILAHTGKRPSAASILRTYRELAVCLEEDRMFG
jgi:carboxylate-amine ligase